MANESEQKIALRVRKRLLFLLGWMSLMVIGVSIWGLVGLEQANERLRRSITMAQTLTEATDVIRQAEVDFKEQVQEWKNILLRGGNEQDFETYRAAFLAQETQVREHLLEADAYLRELELETAALEAFLLGHKELGEKYREALATYQVGNPASAIAVDARVRGIDREPTRQLDRLVEQIERESEEVISRERLDSESRLETHKKFKEVVLILVTASVLGGVIVSVSILRDIEKLRK